MTMIDQSDGCVGCCLLLSEGLAGWRSEIAPLMHSTCHCGAADHQLNQNNLIAFDLDSLRFCGFFWEVQGKERKKEKMIKKRKDADAFMVLKLVAWRRYYRPLFS